MLSSRPVLEVINEQSKPDLDIVEEKAQFALITGDLTQVRELLVTTL